MKIIDVPHFIYNLNEYKGMGINHAIDRIKLRPCHISRTVSFYINGEMPDWLTGHENILKYELNYPDIYTFKIE